jgi:hypothetical protein
VGPNNTKFQVYTNILEWSYLVVLLSNLGICATNNLKLPFVQQIKANTDELNGRDVGLPMYVTESPLEIALHA